MRLKTQHRGPDHSEEYINETENIFLGHSRLSIIDTSSAANH